MGRSTKKKTWQHFHFNIAATLKNGTSTKIDKRSIARLRDSLMREILAYNHGRFIAADLTQDYATCGNQIRIATLEDDDFGNNCENDLLLSDADKNQVDSEENTISEEINCGLILMADENLIDNEESTSLEEDFVKSTMTRKEKTEKLKAVIDNMKDNSEDDAKQFKTGQKISRHAHKLSPGKIEDLEHGDIILNQKSVELAPTFPPRFRFKIPDAKSSTLPKPVFKNYLSDNSNDNSSDAPNKLVTLQVPNTPLPKLNISEKGATTEIDSTPLAESNVQKG